MAHGGGGIDVDCDCDAGNVVDATMMTFVPRKKDPVRMPRHWWLREEGAG